MKIEKQVVRGIVDLVGKNNLRLSYLISVAFCELNDRMEESPGEIESKYGTSLAHVVQTMNERFSEIESK